MDSIGDWLYIVFLAVAVISGLFSSKGKDKKKKGRPEVLDQSDFEEIDFPHSRPAPFPKEEQPVQERKVTSPFSGVSSPSPAAAVIEHEPGVMPEGTFQDMDELKKAIICSEILHRKY